MSNTNINDQRITPEMINTFRTIAMRHGCEHYPDSWFLSPEFAQHRLYTLDFWNTARTPLLTRIAELEAKVASLSMVQDELVSPIERAAARYYHLREKDLNAINSGGVFAGLTPDNKVLNGADLDAAIDREMYTAPLFESAALHVQSTFNVELRYQIFQTWHMRHYNTEPEMYERDAAGEFINKDIADIWRFVGTLTGPLYKKIHWYREKLKEQQGVFSSEFISQIICEVAELGDRTSPDSFPDAMLVTAGELSEILQAHIAMPRVYSNDYWWQKAWIPLYVHTGLKRLRELIECLKDEGVYVDHQQHVNSLASVYNFLEPLLYNRIPNDEQKLKPVEVIRDSHGYWLHPLLKNMDTPHGIKPNSIWDFIESHGHEWYRIYLTVDAPKPIAERYAGGDANVSDWSPSQPPGTGWFVLSIYDTEDGPECLWIRRIFDGVDDA